MAKSNLGRKGFISSCRLKPSSMVEGSQGRNWSRNCGEMLLTGLLPCSHQLPFTHSPGLRLILPPPPPMGWVLLQQLKPRKDPRDAATGQSDSSSTETPFSQVCQNNSQDLDVLSNTNNFWELHNKWGYFPRVTDHSKNQDWVECHTVIVSALGEQEDYPEFEAHLDHTVSSKPG